MLSPVELYYVAARNDGKTIYQIVDGQYNLVLLLLTPALLLTCQIFNEHNVTV